MTVFQSEYDSLNHVFCINSEIKTSVPRLSSYFYPFPIRQSLQEDEDGMLAQVNAMEFFNSQLQRTFVQFNFKTYFGPPPKCLSDFRNLLRTTSEVTFRFPKPTSDHLRSAFPISKTYFGPPPK